MGAKELRKKTASLIATGIILATAVTSQAQMKPDPKLAAMRSVWIEAEDDLSDAPGVATCFAQELHSSLPLTVVGDKNLSQIVLRFRPIDNRIEIAVLQHDAQQLWSGTAAVPAGRTVTLPARRCVAARELIKHLGAAMRCARDRTWYQQPQDEATAPQMSTASPLDSLATQFDVVSSSYQIVEVNRVFWRFSWKMSVHNYGLDTVVVDPELEFHNRDGFIVDTGLSSMRSIRAQETAEITGTTLVNADVAPSVANVLGRVKLVPLTSTTTSLPYARPSS